MLSVITYSTGDNRVLRAISSSAPDDKEITHITVADGATAASKLRALGVSTFVELPRKVGRLRVLSAMPHLVDTRYILFLDEDKWCDQSLLSEWLNFTLLSCCEWSYCDPDACMISRNISTQCRTFEQLVEAFPRTYARFNKRVVRCESTVQSLPHQSSVYLFHFNPQATDTLFSRQADIFDEWSPRIYDGFLANRTVLNGFRAGRIPSSSTCIFTLCHPHELPVETVQRRDIKKVLYAIESPNVRHAKQYDAVFLNTFDVVLTYWEHISHWPCAVPTPQFIHPATEADFVANLSDRRDVGIVLENRNFNVVYPICGTQLRCLDHLRAKYAYGLASLGIDVVAYGKSWKAAAGLTVGDCGKYDRQAGHPHQLLRRHSFALIVENCDAKGYVSEKIFDAICAGCIPLYYGNMSKDLVCIDPKMYVDLREFKELSQLADYITSIDLQRTKQYIVDHRTTALQQVGTARFAQILERALVHEVDRNLILTRDVVLDRSCFPRCYFVFVHDGTHSIAKASVRYIYTTSMEPWDPDVAHRYMDLFRCTDKDVIQPKITGSYSLNWYVFDKALARVPRCMPFDDGLLFALSLCELKIVTI